MRLSKYPDFNLFENILLANILKNHPEFEKKIYMREVSVNMFPQTWGSTAGGFSEPGMFAGQMITTEYTTVMEMTVFIGKKMVPHKFFGVFFGKKPAYLVTDPTDTFFEDLKNKRMKSKYESRQCY
ncbi:MAG: hypothetical protein K6E47_14795 [Lachnospiraceae bacterium]|nr:hypothetical protein [Lachnospiraceae bacterium]